MSEFGLHSMSEFGVRGPWSSFRLWEGVRIVASKEEMNITHIWYTWWFFGIHTIIFGEKSLPAHRSSLFFTALLQTFHKTQLPYKHKPTQTKRSPINGRQLQNKPFLLNHLPTTKMKDFIIRTACLMALATSSSHITSAHPVLRGSEKADEKQHPLRLLKKDTIPNPVPICAAGQCVNSTGGCDTIYECFMDPCELVDCGKKKICQRDFCGGCNYVCVKD